VLFDKVLPYIVFEKKFIYILALKWPAQVTSTELCQLYRQTFVPIFKLNDECKITKTRY